MLGPQLERQHTALVLIDLQREVVAAGSPEARAGFQTAVDAAAEAARTARRLGLPVFLVRVLRRADGADRGTALTDAVLSGRGKPPWEAVPLVACSPGTEWAPPLHAEPTDVIISKARVGAFRGTALDVYLRARSIHTLLLGGLYTHMGVETTLREARDRDFHAVVLADCCAAYPAQWHRHCLDQTFPLLARVATATDAFAHLTQD